MPLDQVQLSLAFGAGAAAAINPCGIAMLPSYVSYLLGKGVAERAGSGLREGLLVGLTMTLSFVSIFVGAGALVSVAGRAVITAVPWLSVGIALALVVLGVGMMAGRSLVALRTTGLADRIERAASGGLRAIFLYGVAYAIASLSCTLPIFLLLVAQAFVAGNPIAGAASFLTYALGMGVVVAAVSVAALTSRGLVNRYLPRIVPVVERLAGAVIAGAGIYIGYYWLFGPGGLLRS